MSLKNNVKQILTKLRRRPAGKTLMDESYNACDLNAEFQTTDQIEQVFKELARYAHHHTALPLDKEIISQCQRALLDCIACIRAGSDTIEGQIILQNFLGFENSTGNASGLESATDGVRHASFTLSCLAQIHDFNDGHPTSGSQGGSFHPGRVIIPSALAASKFHRATGRQLLRWMILGYDLALGTQHPPLQGSCDAIAAAAIFSLAYGLDPDQTAMAMKIACFMAPRTGGDDFELNHLTCAQQAAAACDAALLVKAGYPLRAVPSRYADRFRFLKPEYAGERMLELYFKPYPCCRYIHPFLDLALAIHAETCGRHGGITGISLTIPNHLYGPDSRMIRSYTGKSLQFNFPFCVAAASLTGSLRISHFDPECIIYRKISAIALNTSCSYVDCNEATIAVAFGDGSQIIKRSLILASLGSHDMPIPSKQHEEKLTEHIHDASTSGKVLQMISQIENLDDVDALFESIVQRAP